ncbi:hypothetical protein BOX37_20410 [Nocardia mangyaensis]|uniref:DUF3987 domain-containing protein n=1 Tax=Nocardia mangyaensis TaxID=2213200 RepID=A0A1J0W2L4_9NOCA|nr:hypothetical protein BOX37_20410 [Nocardia mangyaensis]
MRPELDHIRAFARARRAGPWAVLGAVLARAIVATEPNLRLPASVGRAVSLNLFCALVGPSGGGKGAAEGAAAEAVVFVDASGAPIPPTELPVGSGEGLARTFLDGDDEDKTTRALFSAPEVDTLAAIGARQGSTIMGELRKVYMGEQIGFANSNKATRTPVPAHGYRACLLVGVQPLKAGPLLADADGGTPQRFVWLPVDDPDAPDERPSAPRPLEVMVAVGTTNPVEMSVPQIARDAIDSHRLAVLRGEAADPLDGHKMLTRLKIAAALAILAGRIKVSAQDWTLAATVVRVSDRTRAAVIQAATDRARETARARAEVRATEANVIADRADDRIRDRARAAVLRYLDRHPGEKVTRKDLRTHMRNDLRGDLDATLDDLLADAVVIAIGEGVYARA